METYDQMLLEQGGVCDICGKPESAKHSKGNKLLSLSVDHCHETGKVRGLLCRNCNRLTGFVESGRISTEIVNKIITYLETD
jgi:hypothetical protein